MKKIDKKARIAQIEKRLFKHSSKLEARLCRMDAAIVEAKELSKEIGQMKKRKTLNNQISFM